MKQIGLAILNYESARKQLPLAYTPNYTGQIESGPCKGQNASTNLPGNPSNRLPEHFILTFILPYMEQQALFDQIDITTVSTSPTYKADWNTTAISPTKKTINNDVVKVDVDDYICPSTEPRPGRFTTDYFLIADIISNGANGYCALVESAGLATSKRSCDKLLGLLQDTPTSLKKCTDGLSKTFLFFESSGRPNNYDKNRRQIGTMTADYQWADPGVYGVWGNSADPNCKVTSVMNCNNYQGLYSFHTGGGVELFGDGSADFINENIDLDTFISLYTRAAEDIPGTY
jgi:hypothetical protein